MVSLLCHILGVFDSIPKENQQTAFICVAMVDCILIILTAVLISTNKVHIQLN